MGEGPVLTIAGAGTGKTKTLAARVAWLVSQGIDPGRIMLLTFTRRASDEMLRRARRALGETESRTLGTVWGGTFHSVANRLLRTYGQAPRHACPQRLLSAPYWIIVPAIEPIFTLTWIDWIHLR